jgi:hypothetical protein
MGSSRMKGKCSKACKKDDDDGEHFSTCRIRRPAKINTSAESTVLVNGHVSLMVEGRSISGGHRET